MAPADPAVLVGREDLAASRVVRSRAVLADPRVARDLADREALVVLEVLVASADGADLVVVGRSRPSSRRF